jgi:hypothetical protein
MRLCRAGSPGMASATQRIEEALEANANIEIILMALKVAVGEDRQMIVEEFKQQMRVLFGVNYGRFPARRSS